MLFTSGVVVFDIKGAAMVISLARGNGTRSIPRKLENEVLEIAAHDLRSPLHALLLQVQLLGRGADSSGTEFPAHWVRPRLATMEHTIGRAVTLLEGLLEAARSDHSKEEGLEDADLGHIVAEAVIAMRDEAKWAGCAVTFAADVISGQWNRLHVAQIVQNLLSNAIKYGRGFPIEVEARQAESFARVTLRDHGIGIAPKDQERVFERFERASELESRNSYGLGLWIVRRLVAAMSGTISLKSALGEGTTFTVLLPRSPSSA